MLKINFLEKLYSHNGKSTKVFDPINLEITRGEFVSIFGPNGCGKTTLLNLISGLDKDFVGEIHFDSKVKISYIFQNYRESLFPWLTISENISYPLKLLGVSDKRQKMEAQNICNQFNLKLNLSDYPYSLSGGQRQFVAILRGLITKPDILLFDEPFSSLDYQTSIFMLNKIQEIWQKTKTTIIFISHNIDEAIMLSQRIILLSDKPTKIIKTFTNDLNYPRTVGVEGLKEFIALKQEILSTFVHGVNKQLI